MPQDVLDRRPVERNRKLRPLLLVVLPAKLHVAGEVRAAPELVQLLRRRFDRLSHVRVRRLVGERALKGLQCEWGGEASTLHWHAAEPSPPARPHPHHVEDRVGFIEHRMHRVKDHVFERRQGRAVLKIWPGCVFENFSLYAFCSLSPILSTRARSFSSASKPSFWFHVYA